jgi:hypothetical protein
MASAVSQLHLGYPDYQILAGTGTITASGTGSGAWLAEVITFQ